MPARYAAAAEDERVAAFQPHGRFTVLRLADQQRVDAGLRHRVMAFLLADEDLAALRVGEIENGRADQPVMDDDVGGLDQAQCTDGQQFRISRSRANDMDDTLALHNAIIPIPE